MTDFTLALALALALAVASALALALTHPNQVLVTHDDLYDQHKLSAKLNGLTQAGFHYKKDAYNASTQVPSPSPLTPYHHPHP